MDCTDHGVLKQLFVDSLADCAFIVLDVDGKILTWNTGAGAMLGYAEAEIVGRHFSCLYAKEDIDAAKPLMSLAGALAHGRHEEGGRRIRKDGTGLDTRDVLIPLYDPQKKLVGFGNMMREVGSALRAAPDLVEPVAETPKIESAPSNARRKILLLDDNDDVRKAADGMLTSLGYDVIGASSGLQALDLLQHVADVDLLFTDVIMPGGMSGGEVAESARKLQPSLKVLFASGYFEGALVRDGNIKASAQFIVKPYRKTELAKKVEEVLSS